MLDDEPGAEMVRERLDDSCISTVNLAEILGMLCDRGAAAEEAELIFQELGIASENFDASLASVTGGLLPQTSKAGLSLGDRSCLALADRLEATALTGDRAWKRLELGIEIELIR